MKTRKDWSSSSKSRVLLLLLLLVVVVVVIIIIIIIIRKFSQQLGGDGTKTYQQSDAKETEQFWTEKKNTQRKSRMDKQYHKRIRRTRRRPKSGNTHRFTQNNTGGGCPRGAMVKAMDCGIVVSEFVL